MSDHSSVSSPESPPEQSPSAAATTPETPAEPAPEPEPSDRYADAMRRFSGDIRMSKQVWDSMAERGVERQPHHHRLWLDALLAANDVEGAAAQLEAMHEAGISTDATITWKLALSRARQGVPGASEKLDELVRTVPPPPDVLPRLFGIQVRAGRLGPAKATMRKMSDAGVTAAMDDYRPMLADIMDRRAIKDAEALVEHLLTVDAPPTPATATKLVAMMAESGHPDRAEQLVTTFEQGNVQVEQAARESIVMGWAKSNDLKGTRRGIQALEDAGGSANSHHRNLVLESIAGHGDLEGAWREALDMLDTCIPSGSNLDRMLELALKRRDIALSLSAWDWMVMLGVPPAANRAADLVGVVLRDGQLQLAMELYREAIRLEVTPDRRRGEELAAELVNADRLDEAKAFLNELRVRKVLTRGHAWGPLLAGLARKKRTEEVVALVTELATNKMPPTVSDASRTVSSLTKNGALDSARTLLITLAAAGVTVDEPTYRELLWSYARKGKGQECKAVLELMTAAGIEADERHDKAIAWATGETQRRLPEATVEEQEADGESIVAARQTPDATAPAVQQPAADPGPVQPSQPASSESGEAPASAQAPVPPTPTEPQPVTPDPEPTRPVPEPTPVEPTPTPVPEPTQPDPEPTQPDPEPTPVPEPTQPDPEPTPAPEPTKPEPPPGPAEPEPSQPVPDPSPMEPAPPPIRPQPPLGEDAPAAPDVDADGASQETGAASGDEADEHNPGA